MYYNNREYKRGVSYLRVSSPSQALEGVSLESQEEANEHMLRRMGCEEVHTYSDEGLSGRRFDIRVALQEAIALAIEKKADVLLFYDVSRLARNTRHAIEIWEKLVEQHNIELQSVMAYFEPNYNGKKRFIDQASEAERQSSEQGHKVKLSLEEIKRANKFPHVPVVGYKGIRLDTEIRGKKRKPAWIVPDEKWGPAMQNVKEGFANRTLLTYKDCIKQLNRHGIYEGPSGGKLREGRMREWLLNKFHSGFFWHESEEKWRQHPYERLIGPSTQKLIDDRLAKKGKEKRVYRKKSEDFPLKMVTKCAVCGEKLKGYKNNNGKGGIFARYACPTPNCSKSKNPDLVHRDFERFLSEYQADENIIRLFKVILERKQKELNSNNQDSQKAQRKKLHSLITEQENIKKTIIDVGFNSPLGKDLNRDYERIKHEVELLSEELQEQKKAEKIEPLIDRCVEFLQNPYLFWDEGGINTKIGIQEWMFLEGLEYNLEKDFRTRELCTTYKVIGELKQAKNELVTPRRIELRFTD